MPIQDRNGQQQVMLGLADQRQISSKIVVTTPAFQRVLPLMDGSRTLDQIVTEVGGGLTRETLEQFVAQLDDAGLVHGPTFDAIHEAFRKDFDSSDDLPPGVTANFADMLAMQELGQDASDEQKAEVGETKLREILGQWMDKALEKAEDPSFDVLPKAIVVPHVDYPRGWINYASAYGRLRVSDRPDRIVILGTNHFGFGTGVVVCNKGFSSPFGTCKADPDVLEPLRAKLGDALFEHRYDHEREHSIELHIPWIQHVFGQDDSGRFVPVTAALIHDPVVNSGKSYDGTGIDLDPFVEALHGILKDLPGKTLVIASADLSHVGPAFGDQQKLPPAEGGSEELRDRTLKHDQEMLKLFSEGKVEDLATSLAWQQNPTRWCSVGNMTAAMRIVDGSSARILHYMASVDPQGMQLVSSVGAVIE